MAQLGQQMTNVAVAVQVYTLTESSFYVGLVGVFGLGPLVVLGLYGGAFADAVDRRRLALAASAGLWLVALCFAAQAYAAQASVWLLLVLVAVQSGFYALNNPARSAMLPRLLGPGLLPAASALNTASFNLGFTLGPVLGALPISRWGFEAAYTVDVLTFAASFYALLRLPALPPLEDSPRAGIRSVLDGLAFLRRSPNLRMTFVLDLCAMVLAQPRRCSRRWPTRSTAVGRLPSACCRRRRRSGRWWRSPSPAGWARSGCRGSRWWSRCCCTAVPSVPPGWPRPSGGCCSWPMTQNTPRREPIWLPSATIDV